MTDLPSDPSAPGYYAGRASDLVETVTLRDGTPAWIGPLLPGDRADLAREYEGLSSESKRLRFLAGVAHLTPSMLDVLVDDVDGVEHVALVLFFDVDTDPTPVGIGRIVRHRREPEAADIAVTVKDEWQGRGVASALLPLLIARRPPGVTHLLTEVASDNAASLAMLKRLGPTRVHPVGGALDVEVDLIGAGPCCGPPTAGERLHPVLDTPGRDRLKVRDRVAVT